MLNKTNKRLLQERKFRCSTLEGLFTKADYGINSNDIKHDFIII